MPATATDHPKQTTSGRVVFFVGPQVFGENIDLMSKAGDLNLR